MKFINFLGEAFQALRKNPKLFAPKIIVSAIYGVSLVLGAVAIKELLPLAATANSGSISAEYIEALGALMPLMLFMLFWFLFSLFVDIFVNAMYPAMIKRVRERKRVSLKKAASAAKSRSLVVFPAVILILTPMVVLMEVVLLFSQEHFMLSFLLLALLAALLYGYVFYYIYPVLMLERVSVFSGLKRSVFISRKNPSVTIKASLLPFGVSLLDLYLAFDIFNPVNFILFVATRFLIAVIATYHMVLEPTLYFGVKK